MLKNIDENTDGFDIFGVDSLTDFLEALYSGKRKYNPGFSFESWSTELGYRSRSSLQMIIRGERSLPRQLLEKICKLEKYGRRERRYLMLLFDLQQSQIDEDRADIIDKLLEYRGIQRKFSTIKDRETFLAHPDLPKLYLLLGFSGFDKSIANLAQIMRQDEKAIALHLSYLKDQGAAKEENGIWSVGETSFRVPDSMGDKFIQEYHMASALESMAAHDIEKRLRKFRSLLFAVSELEFEALIQELEKFAGKMLQQFDQDSIENRRLYKLNLQVYPVTDFVHGGSNRTGLADLNKNSQ